MVVDIVYLILGPPNLAPKSHPVSAFRDEHGNHNCSVIYHKTHTVFNKIRTFLEISYKRKTQIQFLKIFQINRTKI